MNWRIRWRRIVLSLLVLILLIAAWALWIFWRLIVFFRGEPVFYRLDAVSPLNRGAAATAIVGATLIDGHGGPPLDNSVIVIRGDPIVEAGPAADVTIPADAFQIQAHGKTVLPGLIDMPRSVKHNPHTSERFAPCPSSRRTPTTGSPPQCGQRGEVRSTGGCTLRAADSSANGCRSASNTKTSA